MQDTSKPRIAVLDFQEQGCIPGLGRSTAERIAVRLSESPRYTVVDRPEWLRRMSGQNLDYEMKQECRFHPGWMVERLAMLDLDAAVIGCLKRSPDGKTTISAILVDRSGVVLRRMEKASAEKIASSLMARRIVSAIRMRPGPITARIECVRGSSLMMRLDGDSRLLPKDRMRIDRVLETVPDPYLEDDSKVFAYLTASAGEAEVIETSGRVVVARYLGNSVPQFGDRVTLVKI